MVFLMVMLMFQNNPVKEVMVFDFRKTNQNWIEKWISINDVVMGGLSKGNISFSDSGYAIFSGELRPENYGGFSSVRANLDDTLKGYKGIKLRVNSDGKIYQVRLKTDLAFDGVNYTAKFQTKANEWQEVTIPFSQFIPVFRGRKVEDYPPLKSENIRQLGFLISDKQFGPFELKVEWVKVY